MWLIESREISFLGVYLLMMGNLTPDLVPQLIIPYPENRSAFPF